MNEITQEAYDTHRPKAGRRRHPWKHWLAALMIFGSGIVVGGAGTLGLIQRRIVQHHHKPPGHATKHMMKGLDRRLKLDEKQSGRIQVIVERHMLALREIRNEALPHVHAELEAAREAIAAELESDQAEKWRKSFSRLEQMLPPLPAPELIAPVPEP